MTKLFTAIIFIMLPAIVVAQNDLLDELDKSTVAPTYSAQTFKGTRLVNGHTVETPGKGTLEFIFSHRFGRLNGGLYEFYGLDDAFVRIGLEYGITDRLTAAVGRNSVDKTVDGYLKYKILRQHNTGSPFTITAFGSGAYKSSPKKKDVPTGFKSSDRLAYTGQLLIARKVTSGLSLQLMPTIVHKNFVGDNQGDNDQYALGVGGRVKLTRSVSLNAEYYYRIDADGSTPYQDALGFAIDIETGGHVFQILLTNTRGMVERTFVTETDGDFFDGDIHLGFNVTRAFQVRKQK